LILTHAQRKFLEFHFKNPEVQAKLTDMALTMKRSNHVKQWSLWSLYGTLRFTAIAAGQGDRYQLSNNHIAYYARLIPLHEERLAGFFNTRGKVELPEGTPNGKDIIDTNLSLARWLEGVETAEKATGAVLPTAGNQ